MTSLASLDKAIGRAPSVQLLDQRASYHAHHNDLPAALQDGKKAIQLGREDPTGYIRSGKVLAAMGKDSVALEIYAHGLKRVKHVGQGFELLKKFHDALLAKLSPMNSVDPLTVLPRELALQVLEYMTFRQRVGVCRVSKQWTAFIRSEPRLWAHLDLSGARCKVRSAFISTAINIARKKLTAATLHRLADFDKTFAALGRHCPLRELTLKDTGLQGEHFMAVMMSLKTLRELRIQRGTIIHDLTLRLMMSSTSRDLELLEYVQSPAVSSHSRSSGLIHLSYPKLRSLDVTSTSPFDFYELQDIASRIPMLTTLRFQPDDRSARPTGQFLLHATKLRSCTNLQCLDLNVPALKLSGLQLPDSLVRLSLAGQSSPGILAQLEGLPGWYLPRLTHLELRFDDEIDYKPFLQTHANASSAPIDTSATAVTTTASAKAPEPSRLTYLAIDCLTTLDLNHFAHPRLEQLQTLSLHGSLLNDASYPTLLRPLKHLRKLDASKTHITGVGVKAVVQTGTIRELVLNDCHELGYDAVDWARAQGVKVEHKMSPLMVGGKKLRF